MRLLNLKNFLSGWCVGLFRPNLLERDNIEVAIKKYSKGTKELKHHHKLATEFTIIVSGKVRMNGIEFFEDDIIIVEPGESVEFEAVTDAKTCCIKSVSVKGDKYLD